jgi:hypothetical protein
MKRITAVLVAAAMPAACTDRPHPTAPPHTALEVPAASMEPPVAPLPSALIAVEDALGRVLGGMPDGAAKDELHAALQDLEAALEAQDRCAIRSGRHAAEDALQRVEARAPAELGAELATIALAIGAVEPSEASRCER